MTGLKMSTEALNYSLTYTDIVFDNSMNGYIKIDFISKFIEISKKYNLDGETVIYSIRDNSDLRSIANCIFKRNIQSEEEKLDQKVVIEFMGYVAATYQNLMDGKNYLDIERKAICDIQRDLNLDITGVNFSGAEAYAFYLTEMEDKVDKENKLIRNVG